MEQTTISARLSTALIDACERGLLPDGLVRAGMRSLMRQRLIDEGADNPPLATERLAALVEELRQSPIAKETQAANEQHYEVPAAFFHKHLGPRLKYSCAWYETGSETLAQPGPGLRLGFDVAVDGRAISQRADRGAVELAWAARIH